MTYLYRKATNATATSASATYVTHAVGERSTLRVVVKVGARVRIKVKIWSNGEGQDEGEDERCCEGWTEEKGECRTLSQSSALPGHGHAHGQTQLPAAGASPPQPT